ncbi:MAG: hypothetical protein AAFZ18_31775 [Myxococcota bacterium]
MAREHAETRVLHEASQMENVPEESIDLTIETLAASMHRSRQVKLWFSTEDNLPRGWASTGVKDKPVVVTLKGFDFDAQLSTQTFEVSEDMKRSAVDITSQVEARWAKIAPLLEDRAVLESWAQRIHDRASGHR